MGVGGRDIRTYAPEPWSHMAALMSLEAEMAYRGEVVVWSCLWCMHEC